MRRPRVADGLHSSRWPGSRIAIVPIAAPAASAGSQRARWASVPSHAIGSAASVVETTSGDGTGPRPSASHSTASSSMPAPDPPCASGTASAGQPNARISSQRLRSNPAGSCTMSRTRAMGHERSTKSRPDAASISCSSDRVRSTISSGAAGPGRAGRRRSSAPRACPRRWWSGCCAPSDGGSRPRAVPTDRHRRVGPSGPAARARRGSTSCSSWPLWMRAIEASVLGTSPACCNEMAR